MLRTLCKGSLRQADAKAAYAQAAATSAQKKAQTSGLSTIVKAKDGAVTGPH